MKEMLVPPPQFGLAVDGWLTKLPKDTYCALWLTWPSKYRQSLPVGHSLYVVSFHLEALDIKWISEQANIVNAPIIVLSDNNYYDYEFPANVKCYTYYYWHEQLKTMLAWHGLLQQQKNFTHKYSAVCNRISQSKIYTTTKLLETARTESLIVVNPDFLDLDNVHNWELCNVELLDSLTNIFKEKYLNQHIKIDNFDNSQHNYQRHTSTPWQPLYQNAVINFTNESFQHSFTIIGEKQFIHPGPFITEKTLKCLLGATAFISVGQFDTYGSLEKLGFNFDYGFDTTWDKDSGNLTRFSSIVNLIDTLNHYSIQELHNITKDSATFNQNHIVSGKFYQICNKHNQKVIEEILDLFA